MRGVAGMAKVLAWIAGICALIVVILGIGLWFGGGRAVAWALEHPVSTMIGRQISIGGPVTVRWAAPTRIVIEDLHIANAGWSKEPEMITARRLEIDLFARTLLWGPTRIPVIAVDGAKLLLETSGDGRKNWDFGLKSTAPKKRGEFPDVQLLAVRDGDLRFRNGQTGAESDLAIRKFEFDEPQRSDPVSIAFDGAFQKQPLHLVGTLGPLAHLRDTSDPYPVKLDGKLAQIHLVTDGTIEEPMDADGFDMRISLAGAKLTDLAAALGVPFPELPDFRSTGKLRGGQEHWAIDALSLVVGHSDLEGGIAIDTSQKVPALQANLVSNFLDLADFQGVYGATPPHSSAPPKPADPSGRVLPDTPIAIEKLPGLNADLKFDATQIKSTGGLPFERVSLGLRLQDGVLSVEPLRFHVAQGDVNLVLHFTPFTKDSPPKLHGEIALQHVDLHGLVKNAASAIVRQTGGIAGGFVKIDTYGISTREFLGNMSGDAGIFMQNGQFSHLLQEIADLNVLEAIGVMAAGDRPVPINCFVSRFDIKDGVATASTLLFDTEDTSIVGAGNINFAAETIYMTLTPFHKSFTPLTLRSPVDIQGTLGQPSFHVHPAGLAAKLGTAAGIGILFPPAALLPLIDVGLGEKNSCSAAYAAQKAPEKSNGLSGSSRAKH